MKSTRLLILLLFLSLEGFSQQAVLTSAGEKINLNYLSLLGGTISGTLGVTGNLTITGTTILTNTLVVGNNSTLSGTLTTNGGITNNGTLTNNGNATITGTVTAKNYILSTLSTISSSGSTNIDLSTGNIFKISLGSSISTLTLSNANIGTYILEFIQTTGNFTVAFPASWKWSGGSAPTITATANKTDIITLVYDGTNYFASAVQNF